MPKFTIVIGKAGSVEDPIYHPQDPVMKFTLDHLNICCFSSFAPDLAVTREKVAELAIVSHIQDPLTRFESGDETRMSSANLIVVDRTRNKGNQKRLGKEVP